ncbi:NACHT domain-containing protein [Vibrio jasicida]|uniref:NACHT domain-containing protein n=1 Tax=Vibrio jasicida TaxID=766224 RepID=UPI0011AFEEF0|nr:NACHT domain-containing protein [Vibrio jasicida]
MASLQTIESHLKLHKFLSSKQSELTGDLHAEFNPWAKVENIFRVSEILKNVAVISNIYKKEDSVKISDFYYPSKILKKFDALHDNFNANKYEDFSTNKSIIIEGTVGQGKSILLRHLHNYELHSGNSLPVFIELKDIKEESLIEFITNYINSSLSLRCSKRLFLELLNIGVFSLFFDGFDEVEHSKRAKLVQEINDITQKNKNNKNYCTSRPNNEIQRSTKFDVFCIKPLNEEEQLEFIDKIMDNFEDNKLYKSQLNKNILNMKKDLRGLLQTPLILTLFAMVYRRQVMVPDTPHKFYKRLFNTLVSEHDGMKLGFTRPTISGLSAEEIHTVLEYVSFIYVSKIISGEKKPDFKVIVNGSLDAAQINRGSANKVLEDLTKNTCLIQIDDHEHKFIHESIPFYFAASCIQNNTDDDESQQFYSNRYNNLDEWRHVLDFLQEIDSKNFKKYFLIKQLDSYFIKSKLPEKFIFSERAAKNFSKNFSVLFAYDRTNPKRIFFEINYIPVTDWVAYKYFTESKLPTDKVQLNSIISSTLKELESINTSLILKKKSKFRKPTELSSHYIYQENLDLFLELFELEDSFHSNLNKLPVDRIKKTYIDTKMSIEKHQENKDKGFFSR